MCVFIIRLCLQNSVSYNTQVQIWFLGSGHSNGCSSNNLNLIHTNWNMQIEKEEAFTLTKCINNSNRIVVNILSTIHRDYEIKHKTSD